MAETYRSKDCDVVLTDHFLERVQQNRGKFSSGFTIPHEKIIKAAKRYPGRRCRALVSGQYWAVFVYEPEQNAVVFCTLMPKWYILPEVTVWVALI